MTSKVLNFGEIMNKHIPSGIAIFRRGWQDTITYESSIGEALELCKKWTEQGTYDLVNNSTGEVLFTVSGGRAIWWEEGSLHIH